MHRTLAPALLALLVPLVLVQPARAEEPNADAQRADEARIAALLTAKGPAIVSLKYVQKSGDDESAVTALGVVLDPSGFVMLDDADLGGPETKAVDLKVLFGNDPEEWEAVVVVRDRLLSLAYVQILGLAGKTVAAVDLSVAAEPRLGGDYYGLWREGRGFDYATAHGRLYVTAKVEKPRVMWGVAGEFDRSGLPVFDVAGKVVGVLGTQEGSGEDDASGFGMGGPQSSTFLLPLDDVRKSVEQAKKRVAGVVTKAEEAKKEAGAEGKVDGPKAPDAPKAPGAPEAPATPKAPEAPKAPEQPK